MTELNPQGISYMARQSEKMIETLRRKCVNPEVPWREVFMAFDWSFEADAIKDYVKSMKLISV